MYRYVKRFIDIVCSLIALLIFSPLLLIIAFLIKIDSKGPIIFKQKRVGLHGELFTIYKFRSMKIDAPNLATDKLGDPSQYVTRVGKILRKTSLDELPQLINILKGDMSIVGPRPALYNQYDLIKKREALNIHSIRPGLTGYAQVMGRDFISDDQKVKYDQFYLENMSLMFDLKIIIMTITRVLKSEGVKV